MSARVVDWTSPAAEVVSAVADGDALSYLGGFRLWIHEARLGQGEPAPVADPGALVAFTQSGSPLVVAGDGALVELTRCTLDLAGDACADVRRALEVTEMAPPWRLAAQPFERNEEASAWELSLSRWRCHDIRPEPAGPRVRGDEPALLKNRPFIPHLLRRLGMRPGQTFLDLGCGNGWLAHLALEAGLEVWGLDLLPQVIASAAACTPGGRFEVCDVYELPNRPDLRGRFDLVVCRNLGIAQKIVDWDEPGWVAVGRAVIDLLSPQGVLLWVQMSDGSGRPDENSFTHATLETVRRWLERGGEVIGAWRYGYMAFLVTRPEAAGARRRALRAFDAATVATVLAAHPLGDCASPAQPAARACMRAITLAAAPVFDLEEARRCVVIVGTGRLAQLALEALRYAGVAVLGFVGARPGRFMGLPVCDPAQAADGDPGALVITDPDIPVDVPHAVRIGLGQVAPHGEPRCYVLSGDQDEYFEEAFAPRVAEWDAPRPIRRQRLDNPSFSAWDRGLPSAWGLEGTTEEAVRPAPGRRADQTAVALRAGATATSLSQPVAVPRGAARVVLGAWVCSDRPHAARVQISGRGDDVASSPHPGDGRWHWLELERPLREGETAIVAWCQIVAEGEARFQDARCSFEAAAARRRERTRDLRTEISDQVNALVHQALRRVQLTETVGGRPIDLAMTLRRWQVTFLEGLFVETLLEHEMRSPHARLDVDPFRPRRPRRIPLARTWRRVRHRTLTVWKWLRLGALSRLKRRPAGAGVRRLVFADGNEIKVSSVGGRRYVYHKYLEGLVDLDRMRVDDDTLLVLYGDLRDVPWSVLGAPRVVLLADWGSGPRLAPLLARVSLVASASWTSFFHGVPMPRHVRDHLSGARRILEDLMRADVRTIDAVAHLLSTLEGDLEIVLDSHDYTLFALSQYLLAHTRHTVTAVQRVLGPYTFSYNIRGHAGLFRLPHRILCWGAFHQARLRALGYDCELPATGMHRIELYRRLVAEGRVRTPESVKAVLGIPLDRPVVMFSVVATVFGVPIIDPLRYMDMIRELAALAREGRCFVIFKPWPGEDTGQLEQVVRSCFDDGTWTLVDVRLNARLHNLELLRATDVLLSTVSSFLGEGLALGAVPVLVSGPTARAYFSARYTRQFARFCQVADERRPLGAVLAPLLDPAARAACLAAISPAAAEVFGDGVGTVIPR